MVELLDETSRCPHPELIEGVITELLQTFGVTQNVTLIICDDAFIHKLNLAHRNVDKPTDVLSYPLFDPLDEPANSSGNAKVPTVEQLGDVFISLDTAQRQASEAGRTLLEELIYLAAHGVTHLRGFDHRTEPEWQTFHRAQKHALELYHAKS